ncbi:ZG26-like protein [Mya arenaria]|uniref:ZG26-like protein n=1 Tax=Mya arenaria TaxID=6604 RepID=A0ABY7FJ62_MYAAR|nr:ZG26-like protein [Mya arenaria]
MEITRRAITCKRKRKVKSLPDDFVDPFEKEVSKSVGSQNVKEEDEHPFGEEKWMEKTEMEDVMQRNDNEFSGEKEANKDVSDGNAYKTKYKRAKQPSAKKDSKSQCLNGNDILFQCTNNSCNQQFKLTLKSKHKHKGTDTTNLKIIGCEICTTEFSGLSHYKGHLQSAHPHFVVTKALPIGGEFLDRKTKERIDLYQCTKCSFMCTHLPLPPHPCKREPLKYVCPYCKVEEDEFETMLQHIACEHEDCHDERQHKYETMRNNRKDLAYYVKESEMHCHWCKTAFDSSGTLKKHLNFEHAIHRYCCGLCREAYSRRSALMKHLSSHSPSVRCPQCGRGFRYQSDLKDHMNTHMEEKPHLCGTCGLRFASERTLKHHAMFQHSSSDMEVVESSVAGAGNSVLCEMCGEAFSSQHRLRQHRLQHLDSLQLKKCPHCLIDVRSMNMAGHKRYFHMDKFNHFDDDDIKAVQKTCIVKDIVQNDMAFKHVPPVYEGSTVDLIKMYDYCPDLDIFGTLDADVQTKFKQCEEKDFAANINFEQARDLDKRVSTNTEVQEIALATDELSSFTQAENIETENDAHIQIQTEINDDKLYEELCQTTEAKCEQAICDPISLVTTETRKVVLNAAGEKVMLINESGQEVSLDETVNQAVLLKMGFTVVDEMIGQGTGGGGIQTEGQEGNTQGEVLYDDGVDIQASGWAGQAVKRGTGSSERGISRDATGYSVGVKSQSSYTVKEWVTYTEQDAAVGGQRDFVCQYCDVTYVQQSQLNKHIKRKHSGSGKFACSMCGATFAFEQELQTHKVEHLDYEQQTSILNQFSIDTVDKKSVEKHQLKTQVRENTRKQSNNFMCDECGKSFSHFKTLSGHMLTHRVESVRCKMCLKYFPSEQSLQAHMKYHPAFYQCEHCGQKSTTQSQFRYHQRTRHTGLDMKCAHCERTFHLKHLFLRHVATCQEGEFENVSECEVLSLAPVNRRQDSHLAENLVARRPRLCNNLKRACHRGYKTHPTATQSTYAVKSPPKPVIVTKCILASRQRQKAQQWNQEMGQHLKECART